MNGNQERVMGWIVPSTIQFLRSLSLIVTRSRGVIEAGRTPMQHETGGFSNTERKSVKPKVNRATLANLKPATTLS